jgi:hypothetical protein
MTVRSGPGVSLSQPVLVFFGMTLVNPAHSVALSPFRNDVISPNGPVVWNQTSFLSHT